MPDRQKSAVGSVVGYVLFLLSLSLLLALGSWQWQRGIEKSALEDLLTSTENHYTTIDHAPQNWTELAYQKIRLKGDWMGNQVFLMDNRIYNGQPGYEVFSPFRLANDNTVLLINRGWLAQTATNTLSINSPVNNAVSGQLYIPKKGFTLGPAYIAPPNTHAEFPITIQYFDASALSQAIGIELQPVAVALDEDHPDAFKKIWRAQVMTSSRHFGYAVQWWGLAITLFIFGIIWRRQSVRSSQPRS